jgi:hypothetical protein
MLQAAALLTAAPSPSPTPRDGSPPASPVTTQQDLLTLPAHETPPHAGALSMSMLIPGSDSPLRLPAPIPESMPMLTCGPSGRHPPSVGFALPVHDARAPRLLRCDNLINVHPLPAPPVNGTPSSPGAQHDTVQLSRPILKTGSHWSGLLSLVFMACTEVLSFRACQ